MPRRPTASITEFTVSDSEAGPYGITVGADGALWFTMVHHGRIDRITDGGDTTSYQLDPASSGPVGGAGRPPVPPGHHRRPAGRLAAATGATYRNLHGIDLPTWQS